MKSPNKKKKDKCGMSQAFNGITTKVGIRIDQTKELPYSLDNNYLPIVTLAAPCPIATSMVIL